MVRFLLHRPIAVFMVCMACSIIGIITYKMLPVSLLPDIAIPEITVQVTNNNMSASELDNSVVKVLRTQLRQVEHIENLNSEVRNGSGIVSLRFEHGTNIDLAFIEVNEKIDIAMNFLPKSIQRPRVIKASATDIPVLYLNLTLKESPENTIDSEDRFLELCKFAENIVCRRIEQLPEVAMVDVSGLVHSQVQILPKYSKMKALGIETENIEDMLNNTNVEPASMIIRDGHYEYNIRFSTIIRTLEDVENMPLRHGNRIMKLKDIADVRMSPIAETGLSLYNGRRCVSLAIIKQADENMENMKSALNSTIQSLKNNYPDICFNTSREQTELIDYTQTNLRQNLALGFIFILIVAILFMGDIRSPIIIGICMIVATMICFIFFYLFNISLNIISLSGLILAEGMMIDNMIIVTENISQYHSKTSNIYNVCVRGTNEVITPMLSSSFTTIAVFFPLIFISGIAGDIFYDEALSIAIGLIVSYVISITLLPVLYRVIFMPRTYIRIKKAAYLKSFIHKSCRFTSKKQNAILINLYDKNIERVFAHKKVVCIFIISTLPLCIYFFNALPKEKMPNTNHTEMSVYIDWNENIHLDENRKRMEKLMAFSHGHVNETYTHIGVQQFLLGKKLVSTTEAELYVRTENNEELETLLQMLQQEIKKDYPLAITDYKEPKNIFEYIFDTEEPDLIVKLQNKAEKKLYDLPSLKKIHEDINRVTKETSSIPAHENLVCLIMNYERMQMYGITHDEIITSLKTAMRENNIGTLRSFQDYYPVVVAGKEQDLDGILNRTFVTIPSTENRKEQHHVPLRIFVTQTYTEKLKTITADASGNFVPFAFAKTNHVTEKVNRIEKLLSNNKDGWSANFSGSFFSNQKIMKELTVVLFISLLLMYFILASQFESFIQPLIVLIEIPIDVSIAFCFMEICGISLNLMSAIGIVVSCGIIINDSILKIDMINTLRKNNIPIIEAIHTAGRRRLRSIIMTSLTTILTMISLLMTNDFGSELQRPLALTMIITMTAGTLVSLFIIPLLYWFTYRNRSI